MVDPGHYRLTQGVPVPVSRDASLTLVSVDDSRCPDGVQCIWAGRIVYQLELQSCGTAERFALAPVTVSTAPATTQAVHRLSVAPGLHVALAPGVPPPRSAPSSQPIRTIDIVIGPT